jgi:hypothetical protein
MVELPPQYRKISENLNNHLRECAQSTEACCTEIGVPVFHAKALLVSRFGAAAAMQSVLAEISEGEFVGLMRDAYREACAIHAHGKVPERREPPD